MDALFERHKDEPVRRAEVKHPKRSSLRKLRDISVASSFCARLWRPWLGATGDNADCREPDPRNGRNQHRNAKVGQTSQITSLLLVADRLRADMRCSSKDTSSTHKFQPTQKTKKLLWRSQLGSFMGWGKKTYLIGTIGRFGSHASCCTSTTCRTKTRRLWGSLDCFARGISFANPGEQRHAIRP